MSSRSYARLLSCGFLAAIFAVLCSAGCSIEDETIDVDDSDFDPGQATFSLETSSSLSGSSDDLVFADDDGTVYTLTDGELFIDEIEFELPSFVTCEDIESQLSSAVVCDSAFEDEFSDDETSTDAEIKIEGPFVLDLVTGETTPDIGEVQIPALIYDEIDVELAVAEADMRGVHPGDEIIGKTWLANATFQDEKQTERDLAISVGLETELDVEPEDGIDVPEDGRLVFVLDAARWLENIPLTECRLDGDLKTSGDTVSVSGQTDAGACLSMDERLENTLKASGGFRVED